VRARPKRNEDKAMDDSSVRLLSPSGTVVSVDKAILSRLAAGDVLIPSLSGEPLILGKSEQEAVAASVTRSLAAFRGMLSATDAQVVAFFAHAAARLGDDAVWDAICRTNDADVAAAEAAGRHVGRLRLSEKVRRDMIAGLQTWGASQSIRGHVIETREHEGFRVELVREALGIVGFVFEGRPNVVVDACGVLRGGNVAVLRIGRDALRTAQAIEALAIRPALAEAGLPVDAFIILDSQKHEAAWALFLDKRVSLAVARGSGPAVEFLGSLARGVGTPVSLHGTGGAWMFTTAFTDGARFEEAVGRSLDRKVCNTLNTCCIPTAQAAALLPRFVAGLKHALVTGKKDSVSLHVAHEAGSADAFDRLRGLLAEQLGADVRVAIERIETARLGIEWEWESTPELSVVLVDGLDSAIDLFNDLSPRFVATLVSDDPAEHAQLWQRAEAPFVGDSLTRWVDGAYALSKPELGLSGWGNGRLFGRGGILCGDDVFTVRTRYVSRR